MGSHAILYRSKKCYYCFVEKANAEAETKTKAEAEAKAEAKIKIDNPPKLHKLHKLHKLINFLFENRHPYAHYATRDPSLG
jgi:hypothetical protein